MFPATGSEGEGADDLTQVVECFDPTGSVDRDRCSGGDAERAAPDLTVRANRHEGGLSLDAYDDADLGFHQQLVPGCVVHRDDRPVFTGGAAV